MQVRLSVRRCRFPVRTWTLCLLTGILGLQAHRLAAVDGLDDQPSAPGIFGFDLGAGGSDLSYSCAAQPDGRILLAGTASDDDGESTKIAVLRVGLDGLLDPGFGIGGRVAIDLTAQGYALDSGSARAVLVDSVGRLLVVGTVKVTAGGAVQIFVTRLLADGTIDSTFLFNGISGGWYFSSYLKGVSTAALDPDGNIWIVGPQLANLTGDWSFLRLSPDGAELDAETVAIDPANEWATSFPTSLLFQFNKVVLGGWVRPTATPNQASFLLLRLADFLQLDPTFGFSGSGFALLDYGISAELQSLALLPNGGLVVAGQAGPFVSEDIVVQRLTANGISDGSFEQYVAFDVGGPGGDGTLGQIRMVAQSDGKVVVAARVLTGDSGNTSDVGVARLLTTGSLDTSFGGLGTGKRTFGMAVPPPGNGDDGVSCLILAAGKPIVAGWGEYIGVDTDFAYRRLTNSLIFADPFEAGTTFFWSAAVGVL